MGRKILFITTDQQRYDALGCNGGLIARTPTIDALSKHGITFDRAHPQNVVCMPSRSTMLTGQHVATHGVWMNGVPLPEDAPSIAADLQKTEWALIALRTKIQMIRTVVLTIWNSQLTVRQAHCTTHNGFATTTQKPY
jgi:arylsulfatase A-like enzyme